MSKQKKFTQVEHTHFVITGPLQETVFNGGTVSISVGYVDNAGAVKDRQYPKGEKGRYIEYVASKDDKGRDKAKRFRFDESLRRLLTRDADADIYGKKQYDFLKNHPECEGSPNGSYEEDGVGGKVQVGITFRELDTVKDAGVALDAEELTTLAKASALQLDDTTLTEIANIIGYFGEPDKLMRLKVVEWAGKKPSLYNQLLKSADRGVRAIVRKSLDENIFRTKGDMILWEENIIGVNEDAAVATLLKDTELLTALQGKLGIVPAEKTN